MTDKNTIQLIEGIAKKQEALQNGLHGVEIRQAEQSIKINAIIWIMAAILLAILPAFGFLIAFWVQNSK